jgi:fatty acid desaturase
MLPVLYLLITSILVGLGCAMAFIGSIITNSVGLFVVALLLAAVAVLGGFAVHTAEDAAHKAEELDRRDGK